jgi:hypothetical protein
VVGVRLLAVAVGAVSLGVSCGGTATVRAPNARLVVEAFHPNWPDGKDVESGGINYPNDIYTVDVDGRHLRNLTHDLASNYLLGWSPASQGSFTRTSPATGCEPVVRGSSRSRRMEAICGSSHPEQASFDRCFLPTRIVSCLHEGAGST